MRCEGKSLEEKISILFIFTLLVGFVGGIFLATGNVEKHYAKMLFSTEEKYVQETNELLMSLNVTDQNRTISIAILDWHNQTCYLGAMEEIAGFSIFFVGAIIAGYGFHKWGPKGLKKEKQN